MKTFSTVICLLLLCLCIASCSKDAALSTGQINPVDTTLANLRFVSNPTNLNVVMFVPTDNPAHSDYKPRLSQLLTYFQSWLHEEMKRYGYNQYLGLAKDEATGLVNIIEIPAAGKQAEYFHSMSVFEKIIKEIKAYRAKHPDQFSSSHHYHILLPLPSKGINPPFFGYNRMDFAIDNQDMSINHIPNPNSNYLGGMLHELGHCLNLSHNGEKVSEKPQLGTTLMGYGHISFSRGKPTYLTEVDAAILSRSEVFQAMAPTSPAYEKASFSLKPKLTIDNVNQKLNLSGTFTSDKEVSDILVYLDPDVTKNDKGYNAVAWRFSPGPNNTLNGFINLNELTYKGNTPYKAEIKLLFKNGGLETSTKKLQYNNNELALIED
jgi:hypothetical protein